ncbi:RDD family protein [Nocardioides sp. Bht2]|uniref:RDD family protein n=1 Tax=Nocardioides sp. Bht2 TaxID=3392297 RepID=UPI0039B45D77
MSAQPPYPPPYPEANQPPAGPVAGSVLERFVARFIDGLIVVIPVAIVMGIVLAVLGLWDNLLGTLLYMVLIGVAYFAYYVHFETSRGATIGKQVMKLRTVGAAGGNPTTEEVLKRNIFNATYFVGWVPILGILANLAAFVGMIAIAVTISSDPLGRGWHDKFAGGTRVIKVG